MRLLLPAVLAAVVLAGCGNSVGTFGARPATVARGHVALGIGDQNVAMFSDRRFAGLGVRYTRYAMPWNAIFTEPDRLDAWMRAARGAGQQPLVAFNRSREAECPQNPCELPRLSQYTRAAKAFFARYPWVRDVEAWNEANSPTQPTAKHPERAARYFRALKKACGRCRIPAADLLAGPDVGPWLKRFEQVAGRSRLWGLHNYPDVNRFTAEGTRRFLDLVQGEVWITETGGLVSFSTQRGKATFAPDEKRAARAIRQAVRLAELDRRITRLYLYQWQLTNPQDRFDAGLVRPDNSERPGLAALRQLLLKR